MIKNESAYRIAAADAYQEILRARGLFNSFNSAHEGYAILLEEVDELWEIVKQKQSKRDYAALRKEAIQIAAMALAMAVEIGDSGNQT